MELFVRNIRLTFAVIVAIVAMIFAGCEEGDGDADFGFAHIYMSQATYTGLDNTYPVPGGAGENTFNFKVETLPNGNPDKLQIILGVTRSGKISGAKGFTVNVYVLQITDDTLGELGDNVERMPSTMYTLPDRATVEAGTNSSAFYLTVDVAQLTSIVYSGKRLVLAVGISNPTEYELAENNTYVIVDVDVDAMIDIFLEM